MSDISMAFSTNTADAIDQLIVDAGRMHKVINGSYFEFISVEDGSLIPTLRKALLENLYYQTPVIPWEEGETTEVFNQLYAYTNSISGAVSWWYAPSATATNPVLLPADPSLDGNWKVIVDSATISDVFATKDSPIFSGLPEAPTVNEDDNSDSIATTKFVNSLISKILANILMENAEATTLIVTGDASIFELKVKTLTVEEKMVVKDLEITGSVIGIQTSVDGEHIAPASVKTTGSLEVGGNTTLKGTLKLSGNDLTLGTGETIDLTNVGVKTTLIPATNLNLEKVNGYFSWTTSTLNSPVMGSKGKGLIIAESANDLVQIAWQEVGKLPWVRYMVSGVWGAWINSIATAAVSNNGTATDVAVSPSGVRSFVSQYGVAGRTTQSVQNLDLVVYGSLFSYNVSAQNAPSLSAGRGIYLPASSNNATMLAIENGTNSLYIRYNVDGVWSTWTEFEGKQGPPGDRGFVGASAYAVYVGTVPSGQTPLTEEEWIASLNGNSYSKGGSVTIPAGNTSLVVTHTLSGTPFVVVSPNVKLTSSAWVSNKTSTTFTINLSAAELAAVGFDWVARL